MADEVNPTAVPSADQVPLTPEQLQSEIWSLLPSEASELLEAMAADFHAPPAPTLVPSNAREADVRLQQLISDPEWAGRLLDGDIATHNEFRRLNELKAGLTATDPLIDQIETTVAPGLPRRALISWAEDARSRGFTDEQINFFLNDGKFTRETVALAQRYLPRMEKDPTLLYPDWPQDREYQMEAFKWILSAGTQDMP